MTELSSLWLPILLSAVIVVIASSIIHMASPWHRSDYPRVPNEDRARDVLRTLAIPPGDYMIPRPSSRAELQSAEFAEKIKTGPVIMLTVLPNGPMSMGRNLSLWFLYCTAVSVFAAYIAGRGLPRGVQVRGSDRVHRLLGRAVADVHLVSALVDHDLQRNG